MLIAYGDNAMLYNLFNNLAIVAQLILIAFFLKDHKAACTFPHIIDKHLQKRSKKEFLFGSIFMYIELVFVILVLTLIGNSSVDAITIPFLGVHKENFFPNIFVIPVVAFILFILLKISPFKLLDITAIVMSVTLIFFKIACWFGGCCYGIEYGSTFYNNKTGRYDVPVQLIEIACAVIMLVILVIMYKRKNKKAGLLYPVFIIMFCGSFFFIQFLRGDLQKNFGPLNGFHIMSLIGLALGVIYLVIVLKFGTRITEYFETKNQSYLNRKLKEYDRKHRKNYRKHKKL